MYINMCINVGGKNTHICIQACAWTYTCICIHIHTHVHTRTGSQAWSIRSQGGIHIHMYTDMYINVKIGPASRREAPHTYVCACMYIHVQVGHLLTGVEHQEPRWRKCYQSTKNNLPDEVFMIVFVCIL